MYATQKWRPETAPSGDPYYSHPVEVAGILTDLRLDTASIATALLHDTIEDTDATFGEIEKIFGREIADMVNGVTKMSLLELSSADMAQAENFRKLLRPRPAMCAFFWSSWPTGCTICDAAFHFFRQKAQTHRARNAGYLCAFGRSRRHAKLPRRLEDLAFAEVNKEGRELIVERLDELKQDSGDMLEAIAYEFSALLGENGIKAPVHGRQKRPFSIWRKMQNKSISLSSCRTCSAIALSWPMRRLLSGARRAASQFPLCAGRYKDYISTPKLNGYQSLHTTVIGPNQQRGVQIRTEHMHDIAERGVAAHWTYKDSTEDYPDTAKIEPFAWLQDMVGQLKNGGSAEEFLKNTKLELFNDQMFCFTPKGRLIAMPRGATRWISPMPCIRRLAIAVSACVLTASNCRSALC